LKEYIVQGYASRDTKNSLNILLPYFQYDSSKH
jgi:hypothetical protein